MEGGRRVTLRIASHRATSDFPVQVGACTGADGLCPSAAEPQPNPYIHSDFTEGNEGNEGPGQKLRLFVVFVTFCKNSEI
jgi:hypothetical protein